MQDQTRSVPPNTDAEAAAREIKLGTRHRPPRTDDETFAILREHLGGELPPVLPYRSSDSHLGLLGYCQGDYADRGPQEPEGPEDPTGVLTRRNH
jgi:hypothetical protein